MKEKELLKWLDYFYFDFRGELRPGIDWKPRQAYEQITGIIKRIYRLRAINKTLREINRGKNETQ